jgi:hypothetical protein
MTMARTRKATSTAPSEPEAKRLKTSPSPPSTAPESPTCLHCTQPIHQASLAPPTGAEPSLVLAVTYTPAVSPPSASSPAEDPTVALQRAENERKLRAARELGVELAYRNRPPNTTKAYKKAQSL